LPHSKLVSFNAVPEEQFNALLSRSALYLSFSFEDAGITGLKALAFGVPILCPHQSGLAYAVEYRTENCYLDPFDFADITSLARNILSSQSDPDRYRRHFTDLKEKSNEAATAWLESMQSSLSTWLACTTYRNPVHK
jgi:glycosyltransferase involved in cell wall biosynthesis